jgi:uncharacterized iron-regulated membrane protein
MSVVDDPVSAPPPTTELDSSDTLADAAGSTAAGRTPKSGGGWFRAFWRWHFYASALVLPILLMLAVTGLIYLFRWQIDPAMHPGLITVDVPAAAGPVSYAQQEAAALAAVPDSTVQSVQQGHDNRASVFTVLTGDEETRAVYVDQYTGKALGSINPAHLLSNIAVEVHGKIVFGSFSEIGLFNDPIVGEELTIGGAGDRVIELGACWAIVMAITGYYLFFRGRTARLRRLAKNAPASRLRNRHAVVGAILGVGILLLVVSGLPWTGLWGGKVQQWASGHGLSMWGEDPGAESSLAKRLDEIGSTSAPAPWAEGASEVPESDPHAGHIQGAVGKPSSDRIGVDQAMASATAVGLAAPYYVTYPEGEKGVFSVLSDQWHDKGNPAFSDVSKERTVHVDQYTGSVLAQYSYQDYTTAAKVVSQGIALHEGRRLGSFNLVGTTAFCLGIIFLCISAPLMWWKRRPSKGGLAAPRGRMPMRAAPGLALALVALGVFLPLFGVSLLLILLFDQLAVRRIPLLRRAFDPA